MAEITSAKATARTVRVSPRKSRLVLDNIRGKSVADATAILKQSCKHYRRSFKLSNR